MEKPLLLNKMSSRILFPFIVFLCFSFTQVDAQNRMYVDASAGGSNTGTSWTDAYVDLQDALSNATTGDTIWVATGTYKPTSSTDRSINFQIPDQMALYGGFSGTESQLSQRDWRTNETILSADIGTQNDSTDNSYYLVYFNNVSNQTLLDGFTIREANNDDAGKGGGIYLLASGSGNSCNPVIQNCKISDSHADNGGGIFIHGDGGTAAPEVINCKISGNHASSGGGIYNEADNSGTVTPVFKNCIITGNKVSNFGGAVHNWIALGGSGTTAPVFVNTTISGNYAGDSGSALYNVYSDCTPTLRNCILWGNNEAYSQISNNVDANPTFSYCNIEMGFINGWHTDFGTDGGNNMDADPSFVDMPDFSVAPTNTGNVALDDHSPSINSGNPTEDTTGWSLDRAGNQRIYADTIDMGALESQNLAPYVVTPLADQAFPEHAPDTVIADLNEVFTDYEQNGDLTFNIDGNTNPDLITPAIQSADSTLLLSFSAMPGGVAEMTISATDDAGATDTLSFTVTVNKIPELFYVDSSATGNQSGKSWENAFNHLQNALAWASKDDTLWMASGTYFPDQGEGYQDDARDASFVIPDSVLVYGGFAGTEEDLDERDLSGEPTILDGDIDQDGTINNNAWHVVTFVNASEQTVLDGVTITGGSADGSFPDNRGGGILNDGTGNGNRSNPRIMNCIIAGNEAGKGGGVYNYARSAGVTKPFFVNCVFKGNSAGEGGGMFNDGYNGESSPTLINCTFSGNAGSNSGALYNWGYSGVSAPSLVNCNIWGNESKLQQVRNDDATISYENCNIEGRAAQGTNISSDPFFVQMPDHTNAPARSGNVTLYSNSPCINAGNNTAADTLVQTDLHGSPRIQEGTIDIGAYEGGISIDARRIYVDAQAGGDNDGTSWSNAFTSLQDALDQASFADSIWVAAGTYLPEKDKHGNGTPSDLRTKTFFIPNYVKMYGGFDGTETSLSGRNPQENETILSGDLGTVGDSIDNAYHVVYFENVHALTLLSGFTIQHGNADGSGENARGGGIYNVASEYGQKSNPQISNCLITENDAASGAGIYNDGEKGACQPELFHCSISFNEATSNGGGIYNMGCSPELISCIISHNTAAGDGGGAYNNPYSTSSVIKPVFANCLIYGNHASRGAAMMNRGNGSPWPELINCVLAGNQGDESMYNRSEPTGGPTIANSIIMGHIVNDMNAVPDISHSNIRNSGGSGPDWNENLGNDKGYNIDANPRFTGASVYNPVPESPDGFRLYAGSPCINAGSNDSISEPLDLAGDNRIQDGTVDIGVFEGGTAMDEKVLYVDSAASGNQDGSSWADAYNDLTDALASARFGDTIWVAEGTYYPAAHRSGNPTPSDNRAKTFSIPDMVKIYGGFSGSETRLNERHPDTNRTLLSGDLGTPNDPSDNAYHVVYFDHVGEQTLLDGFEIAGGQADGSNSEGGGIFNDGSGYPTSSPVVKNCKITGNQGSKGGGIYSIAENFENRLQLVNCFISGNQADKGGGLYTYARTGGNDSTVLINCIFSGNAADYGGGIYTYADNGTCNPRLINCTLSGNHSSVLGSAMFNEETAPHLTNCIIWNNSGGGISMLNASPSYDYCNIEGSGGSTSWDGSYGNDQGNNMDEDPLFVMGVSYQDAPTTAGDFRLYEGSPCTDTGDDAANTESYDIAGNARIQNTTIDMGAYEGAVAIPQAYYVDKDATGNNDGSSWKHAYTNLQDALTRPNEYNVPIWVAAGTYYPDEGAHQTADDRNATFEIPDSVKVYGGFTGSETQLSQQDPQSHETVLNGDIGIAGDNTDNAYHVVYFESVGEETLLDGLTITGGNAEGGHGGGIFNIATETGGPSKPHITDCMIQANTANGAGGGIYNKGDFDTDGCSPVLKNTQIINNNGGGIFNDAEGGYAASPILINCIISGNNGDGIYNYGNGCQASPRLTNCLISGNKGDGIRNYTNNSGESSPVLINCSVVGNESYAMSNSNNGGTCNPEIISSVLWNNNTMNSGIQVNNNNASPSYLYSDIQGSGGSAGWNTELGVDEGNNIDADPLFLNEPDYTSFPTTEGNFHLFTASPCLDQGFNDSVSVANDLDNETRIQNGTVDMGPFEGGDPDDLSPELQTKDTTVFLDESGTGSIETGDVVLQASDNIHVADTTVSRSEFNCSDVGVVGIEVAITDGSGNTTTDNADITVQDTLPPDLTIKNISLYLGDDGSATVDPSDLITGVSDNCSMADTSLSQTNFTTADIGDVNVDVTVTDVSGNSTTKTAVVAVTDQPLTKYTLTFHVDDQGGSPIEDAEITLDGEFLAMTDADGMASVDTTNGTYSYTITKTGYEEASGSVTISDSDKNADVTLTEAVTTYTATFSITDDNADPVEGATININGNNLTSNADGMASVKLPNGEYDYTVIKTGYDNAAGTVTISDANITEEVSLTPASVDRYAVTFHVVDENAGALQGAAVAIDQYNLSTDAGGQASIELADGSYDYTASLSGYQSVEGSVTVSGADITEEVALSLLRYTITFHIEDENSNGIEGAEIAIDGRAMASTDAGGVGKVDTTNGTYEYTVSKSGYHSETSSLTIEGSDVAENVTLTEESTGILTINGKSVKIYPNPANGRVYIETEIKDLSVAVLNVTGRLIYNGIIQDSRHQINVESYPSGMYIIRLKKDGRIHNHRLLVR